MVDSETFHTPVLRAAAPGLSLCLRAGSGAAYKRAQRAVLELHEALKAAGKAPEFQRGVVKLLSTHGHRRAWIDRLQRAGLM